MCTEGEMAVYRTCTLNMMWVWSRRSIGLVNCHVPVHSKEIV